MVTATARKSWTIPEDARWPMDIVKTPSREKTRKEMVFKNLFHQFERVLNLKAHGVRL